MDASLKVFFLWVSMGFSVLDGVSGVGSSVLWKMFYVDRM